MEVRFYLLRDGMLRQDLELAAVGTPKVLMNAAGDIKTSLRGCFRENPEARLLTDHIVCVIDGQSCGEFVVSCCESVLDGDCSLWQLEAYDQALLVSRNRQESRRSALAGSSYMELIQGLLGDCGIYRILADRCDEVLAADREWELGAVTLDIVNQLLEEIGFDSLWFDSDGNARLQKYCPPTGDSVRHIYGPGDCAPEMDCRSSWDVFTAKNVFVVVADSPDRSQTLTASASNDDKNSPVSTVHLGRIMAPVTVVENVASQEALQTCADRLRDESMLSAQTVTFYTLPNIHQVGELVALEHPQLEGIFREIRWELELGESGRMCHEGRRVLFL